MIGPDSPGWLAHQERKQQARDRQRQKGGKPKKRELNWDRIVIWSGLAIAIAWNVAHGLPPF